jgi:hypothetical protein
MKEAKKEKERKKERRKYEKGEMQLGTPAVETRFL